jgi:hypothetical protein
MRSAASCGHPLQVIVAPRGALTWRLRMLIVLKSCVTHDRRGKRTQSIVIAAGCALKEAI